MVLRDPRPWDNSHLTRGQIKLPGIWHLCDGFWFFLFLGFWKSCRGTLGKCHRVAAELEMIYALIVSVVVVGKLQLSRTKLGSDYGLVLDLLWVSAWSSEYGVWRLRVRVSQAVDFVTRGCPVIIYEANGAICSQVGTVTQSVKLNNCVSLNAACYLHSIV